MATECVTSVVAFVEHQCTSIKSVVAFEEHQRTCVISVVAFVEHQIIFNACAISGRKLF